MYEIRFEHRPESTWPCRALIYFRDEFVTCAEVGRSWTDVEESARKIIEKHRAAYGAGSVPAPIVVE